LRLSDVEKFPGYGSTHCPPDEIPLNDPHHPNRQARDIDCFDDAAVFAAERQWAGDQKITEFDGGVTIEFTSTQYDKVLKWVLSCGCNAIPRKPKSLIDGWKWHVSEMRI